MLVLVVEDEFLIREFVCMDLAEAGYDVIQAENADEALRKLVTHDVRLLITDIDMPGSKNGLELAAEVRDRWPPIKIIVASGKHTPKANEMPDGTVFLPKPYISRHVFDAIGQI